MVGNGNKRRDLQCIFDLATFEIEGEMRRKRWGPVTSLVIEFETEISVVALAVGKDGAEDVIVASPVGKKIELLLG